MGKILNALQHPDRNGVPGTPARDDPAPALRAARADAPETADEENEDQVPFIEVGPHRSMEGSPDVLASQVRAGRESPSVPIGPRLVAEPVEAAGPPLFRQVPGIHGPRFAAELVAYHRPDHALSQQYSRLIQPLLAPAPEGRARVLLFSAARPGCGTTTVLLNLAITAARHSRKRVVVVDGNLRRPALAQRLGLGEVAGLRDVLSGTLPMEQALQETDQANLFALPAGKPQPIQGIRYLAEPIRSLLRQLRHRFDLVLVDGPRWDGQPDVVMLGAACDAVYLVVSEQEAESAQVDELYQSIPGQGANLGGCILI